MTDKAKEPTKAEIAAAKAELEAQAARDAAQRQADADAALKAGEQEATARTAEIRANPPKIIVGVIRNGALTDAEKRHTYELNDLDGQAAVLVVLPRTSSDVVGPETVIMASDVLWDTAETLRLHAAVDKRPAIDVSGL